MFKMELKQPVRLLDLSSHALGSVIVDQALFLIEKNCSETENVNKVDNNDFELSIRKFAQYYDTAIPPIMHNLITYHTLQHLKENIYQSPENDLLFDIVFKSHVTTFDFNDWPLEMLFDIVFRSHLTKFDFNDWPSKMHSMLYKNLSKLKHLKFLSISSLTTNDNLSNVVEALKVMKQLEIFDCSRSGCFDNIVEVLCDNCPLISLNFHSYFLNNSSVNHLLKLCNLEELYINYTHITELRSKELLLGLPQLKTLKGLEQFPSECDILTSLQSVEVRCQSQQTVTNLTLYCPSVVNLNLIIGEPFDLSDVTNLNYLTTLRITARYFYVSNINTILQRRGHQITDLSLWGMSDISTAMLLNEISTSCLNLRKLLIALDFSGIDTGVFPTGNRSAFQNLEFVHLDSFGSEDMASYFIYLLCASVKIKEATCGSAYKLCDEDMKKIISFNPLAHLEVLYISRHRLTVQSIYKLLSLCRELRYIGYVGTNVKSELEQLCNYVQKNNLNVGFINDLIELRKKKCVSVMKPEWSDLSQSAWYM